MNYRELLHYIVNRLSVLYPGPEATEMAYRLLETYEGMTKIDIALSTVNSLEISPVITKALQALEKGEPLQYVMQYADFYDLKFEVNTSVLIPRPETEELVSLVLESITHQESVLDIGTGSGCIPISIKKNKPYLKVSACDISLDALTVAKRNAHNNGVELDFFVCDILKESFSQSYDIIISNPPYVRPSEKAAMRSNVLDYEPHLALFVEEDEPLIFYERIANIALSKLNDRGLLFFEINEEFGAETVKILEEKAFVNVELYQDINGKDRMIKAQRPDI